MVRFLSPQLKRKSSGLMRSLPGTQVSPRQSHQNRKTLRPTMPRVENSGRGPHLPEHGRLRKWPPRSFARPTFSSLRSDYGAAIFAHCNRRTRCKAGVPQKIVGGLASESTHVDAIAVQVSRVSGLWVRVPRLPPGTHALGRAEKVPAFQAGKAGSTPGTAATSGGRALSGIG